MRSFSGCVSASAAKTASDCTLRDCKSLGFGLVNARSRYVPSLLDVWVSMGEEAKTAERIKMLRPYQINMDLMRATGSRSDSKRDTERVTTRTSDASDMLQYSTSPGNVEIQPDYAVTDDGR